MFFGRYRYMKKKLVKAQVHIRRSRGSFGGLRWTHPSFSYQKVLVIEECSSQDRARSTLVLEVKVYQELSIRQWIVTTKSYVNQVDRTFTRKSQEQELHVSSRPFFVTYPSEYSISIVKECVGWIVLLNFRDTNQVYHFRRNDAYFHHWIESGIGRPLNESYLNYNCSDPDLDLDPRIGAIGDRQQHSDQNMAISNGD